MEQNNSLNSNVVNLSSFSLRQEEENLLNKGLKFCPTPALHEHQNGKDMNEFCRKLRLTEFFNDLPVNEEDIVKSKSSWNPEKGRNEHLDSSIAYLQSLAKFDTKSRVNKISNMSKSDKIGLDSLLSNKSIVIKEADKGSAIVIMNKEYYKDNIERLLGDALTCMQLMENSDNKIMNKINKFADKHKDILTTNEIKYLTKFDYKTSQFYGLPKIHKSSLIKEKILNSDIVNIENQADLPFRPIVAGPQCPTHKLSHFMDIILHISLNIFPHT